MPRNAVDDIIDALNIRIAFLTLKGSELIEEQKKQKDKLDKLNAAFTRLNPIQADYVHVRLTPDRLKKKLKAFRGKENEFFRKGERDMLERFGRLSKETQKKLLAILTEKIKTLDQRMTQDKGVNDTVIVRESYPYPKKDTDLPPDLQQEPGPTSLADVTPTKLPIIYKNFEELARDIAGIQIDLIDRWHVTLNNFETVLTSSSFNSTSPDVLKIFTDGLKDAVLIPTSKIPGFGELKKLFDGIGTAVEEADKARQSVGLRDFVVKMRIKIGTLSTEYKQRIETFVGIVKRKALSLPEGERIFYRDRLIDSLTELRNKSINHNQDKLFILLVEKWLNTTTNPSHPEARRRNDFQTRSKISFTITPIYGPWIVTNAHIFAPGGQKIAEILTNNGTKRVSLHKLRVKRVLDYKQPDSSAWVTLNEYGQDASLGSYAENPHLGSMVYRKFLKDGLPSANEVTGE